MKDIIPEDEFDYFTGYVAMINESKNDNQDTGGCTIVATLFSGIIVIAILLVLAYFGVI